jgi:hypothetical protein
MHQQLLVDNEMLCALELTNGRAERTLQELLLANRQSIYTDWQQQQQQ